jgi:hypothetical protein
MKPFASLQQMRGAHEAMFGDAGRQAADIVLDLAPRLFATPLDPLTIRVVLAPIELGPYNRHRGYHSGDGANTLILGNRHQCRLEGDDIVLGNVGEFTDFICHELTHARQATLMREHGWNRTRGGVHRDRGWYAAIGEAAPNYLGVALPSSVWPTGSRTRRGTLTEVEMAHWPVSVRRLIVAGDSRLVAVTEAEAA